MSITPAFDVDNKVLDELKDYWNDRSFSYSTSNIEELNCYKRDVWMKVLLENAPKRERMNVLDVGAGPGFFSILMASAGHKVTAVDVTAGMLEHAKNNGKSYGLDISCVQIFGEQLPFEEKYFDLIVNRNVTWNIENPQEAINEWSRVLKPGGRAVYFDANWYLYLYNEDMRIKRTIAHDNFVKKYGNIQDIHQERNRRCEAIAKNLVLSHEYRPDWDKKAVEAAGLDLATVDEEIWRRVWDEKEQIQNAASPMFMVVAQKGE